MSFDIYLWFGDVVKCREDIFYVEVKYKEMVDQYLMQMEFINYD